MPEKKPLRKKMQTFLPYSDFEKSAKVLDNKRLGKQRVEVLQILNALLNNGGWRNHPATRMWEDNVGSLIEYGLAICREWKDRGYSDTCLDKIADIAITHNIENNEKPIWLGEERLHRSHRIALLCKNYDHYSQHFRNKEELEMSSSGATYEYYWPK